MDLGHHVAADRAADGMPVQVERDRGHGGAHRDAKNSHVVALRYHVDRVHRWGLQTNIIIIEEDITRPYFYRNNSILSGSGSNISNKFLTIELLFY